MGNCKFNIAWVGKCNEKTQNDYCKKHSQMKCSVCGEQATHDCYETGFLVCGSPLCDNKFCKIVHDVRQHGCNIDDYKNKLTTNEYLLLKIILFQDSQYHLKFNDIMQLLKKGCDLYENIFNSNC